MSEDLEDVWRDIRPPRLPPPELDLWCDPIGNVTSMRMDAGTISFSVGGVDEKEVLRCTADGRIFVHGRLATTDLEVVDALRSFLLSTARP